MRLITKLALTIALLLARRISSPHPRHNPRRIFLLMARSPRTRRSGAHVQGIVTMDIPSGYHVNSNRPLERFLIATQLQVEAPKGIRVGPILYPRPLMRSLSFQKARFRFSRPHDNSFHCNRDRKFHWNSVELKARLKFQSCNDDACFQPQTRETSYG